MPPLALKEQSGVAQFTAYADRLSSIVEVLELHTPEQEQQAARLLRAVSTLSDRLEQERKREKEPHLVAGREVDERFRTPKTELDRISALIRHRLSEAAASREKRRLAAIAIASSASPAVANEALANAPQSVELQGVGELWSWEPTSFDLKKIPIEYLSVDLQKVRAYIRECNKSGASPQIPGVVFERKITHQVRRL